jgi:hypothetical protein
VTIQSHMTTILPVASRLPVFVSLNSILNSSNLEALDQAYTQTQDAIANLYDKYNSILCNPKFKLTQP